MALKYKSPEDRNQAHKLTTQPIVDGMAVAAHASQIC